MKLAIVIFVLIIAIIAMLLFACNPPFSLINNCNLNNFSSYGNFIAGSLGTLAAIIAAIFIFFTWINQNNYSKKQELYYQKQIKYNEKLFFENNYYKMIDNLLKQIDSLYYDISSDVSNPNPYKGVNFLSFCIRDFFKLNNFENEQNLKQTFNQRKKIFYTQLIDIFFSISFIYKFINDYQTDQVNYTYMNYFTIQIPQDLKLMIAIFRVCDNEKVIDLVDKYKILNNFDLSNFFQNDNQLNNFTSLLKLQK